MSDIATTEGRLSTLDAVRGFAVCGILLMNIVAMGLPTLAYTNPYFYGTEGPADWAAWGVNYVFSEGKMRGLFTMLFGASMVLICERAERHDQSAAEIHYRRIFWLFIFGMVHAWFLWFGDILVQYAAAAAMGFFFWRWPPRALWTVVAAMTAVQALQYWDLYAVAGQTSTSLGSAASAEREIASYRGGFAEVFAVRAQMTAYFQSTLVPQFLPETLSFMALGIILYRSGFLTGNWARRRYLQMIALGYLLAAPLHLPIAWVLVERRFDTAAFAGSEAAGLLLRPLVALAHASMIILLLKSGAAIRLTRRLEAAGRMAFSNYLGTTFIATTVFYGYGLGLYGALSRAELYWVVLVIWALILLWSKPWLARFRYGPLEWLWRSLAKGERQPMRREPAT